MGTKLFKKSEWLTAQQIKRYLGQLSALNKANKPQWVSANQMQQDPVEEIEQEELDIAQEIGNRSTLRRIL